jgi:hypothetical protein
MQTRREVKGSNACMCHFGQLLVVVGDLDIVTNRWAAPFC